MEYATEGDIMNMVFNARTVIGWLIVSILVVIPRMLLYFGLKSAELDSLTSLWATFLIIFVAEVIILWGYIREVKTAIFSIVLAIIIAFLLTNFFG